MRGQMAKRGVCALKRCLNYLLAKEVVGILVMDTSELAVSGQKKAELVLLPR